MQRVAVKDGLHEIETQLRRLSELERRVLAKLLRRETVTRDTVTTFDEQLSVGDRVADRMAAFGGSWTFILLFLVTMLAWIVFNEMTAQPIDPFPFILLNLGLSCLAALQAPVILMSQNRMASMDRLDARHDYEVNLKAETEIGGLHEKMDRLRERELAELTVLIERQTQALARIEERLAARGMG